MKNFLHRLARSMSNATTRNAPQRQAAISRLVLDAMSTGVDTPNGIYTVTVPVAGVNEDVPTSLDWDIQVAVEDGYLMWARSWPIGRWHYNEDGTPREMSPDAEWRRSSRGQPGYKV